MAWYHEINREQWKVLLAAQLGWMLDAMDVMLYSMVLVHLMRELGMSKAEGGLLNSLTGRPLSGASVETSSFTSTSTGRSVSDAGGYYYLPLLSPGMYRVRVTAPGFQSQEVHELEQ